MLYVQVSTIWLRCDNPHLNDGKCTSHAKGSVPLATEDSIVMVPAGSVTGVHSLAQWIDNVHNVQLKIVPVINNRWLPRCVYTTGAIM